LAIPVDQKLGEIPLDLISQIVFRVSAISRRMGMLQKAPFSVTFLEYTLATATGTQEAANKVAAK